MTGGAPLPIQWHDDILMYKLQEEFIISSDYSYNYSYTDNSCGVGEWNLVHLDGPLRVYM